MDTGRYLTVDELIAMHDRDDLLALAKIGGFNSADGPQIDTARLQRQIDRAQSFIDSFVRARFPRLGDLDAAAMPASLKGAASDLVIYWLRDRVGDQAGVDDVVRARYRDVVDWLRDIRDGKTDLGADIPGIAEGGGPTDTIQGSFPESRAAEILEGYQ